MVPIEDSQGDQWNQTLVYVWFMFWLNESAVTRQWEREEAFEKLGQTTD